MLKKETTRTSTRKYEKAKKCEVTMQRASVETTTSQQNLRYT